MAKKSDSATSQTLSQLSKVTPQFQRRWTKNLPLVLLLTLAAFALLYLWLPNEPEEGAPLQQPSRQSFEDTLSSNLARLEALKKKTEATQQTTPLKFHARTKPPKLRHKEILSKELLLRMNAPAGFNLRTPKSSAATMSPTAGNNALLNGRDNNSQFLNQSSAISSVTAQNLPHPDFTVAAGELVPAVLETAINSDLPGFARAITTRDVYSLTGANRLIPKGSVLIGQFASNLAEGQSRILIQWMRIARPDGVVVDLQSPGTDSLGRAGLGADSINRHFFERFGTASLLSIIGASTATAGVANQDQYNSASAYRIALAESFNQAASQTLNKSIAIPPTLEVNQGTLIHVFVAHDLDFNQVGAVNEDIVESPLYEEALWKD